MDKRLKGTLFGAVAAITYGTNPLFSLPLYEYGMSTGSILFYRYVFAVVLLGIILKVRGESLAIKKKEVLPLFVLGILFAMSSWLLYKSFLYMDAGIACTILFVYPVMVALIMTLFFKEKASWLTYGCICLTMVGIAMLYDGGQAAVSRTGLILVVLSSLCYAIYIVGVNRSVLKDMPAGKMTFWSILFGLLVFVVGTGFFTGLQAIPPTLSGWGSVLGSAIFPTVISIMFINISIKNIGATFAAILGALEPVTALVIGVSVFDEQLTARVVIGAALILIAVSLVAGGKPLLQKLGVRSK